jgi:peptidyl-prolyl cis-trans isomerase D
MAFGALERCLAAFRLATYDAAARASNRERLALRRGECKQPTGRFCGVALDTLRKGAGRLFGMILMGLLVISFAIWGIADIFRGYGSQTLIRVGDTEITAQQYARAQQDVLRSMSSSAGHSLSLQEARETGLEKRVLERLIGGAALDTHAKSLHLGVSDESLLESIKKDPAFQDATGNFNPIALQQALRTLDMNEQGFLVKEREQDLRRQLLSTIGKTATTPEVFLTAFNNYNNETRGLRYVIVPKTAAGSVPEPTEENLKSYYDNHHAKFTQAELRKIGVIAVTPETVKDKVQISEDDLKAAFEKDKGTLGTLERRQVQQISFPDKAAADAAYQKIQSGADFVAVAKEQGLSESDIDLGLLKQAEMADAAIADAAFKLEKDKVSEPVAGQLGKTALLRVTVIEPGKVLTYDEAKPELEKKILKDRAQAAIFDLHDRIEDERASGTQLSEVADKLKLTYQVFDQVDRRGQAPDGTALTLPVKTDLLNSAFTTDVGVENDPLDGKDEGLVWYEVLGVTPQQLKPMDQVKEELTKDWLVDEERSRLAKYTEDLVKSLSGGKPLEDVAKDLNGQVLTTEPLKRNGMTINVLPNAVLQAFALPQGGYGSAPSGVDEGRIVFQVDKVTPPPPLEAPSQEQLKHRLAGFIGEDIIGEYFTALEARYGVSVNQQALAKLAGGGEEQ